MLQREAPKRAFATLIAVFGTESAGSMGKAGIRDNVARVR
jgi:hypothetical protein